VALSFLSCDLCSIPTAVFDDTVLRTFTLYFLTVNKNKGTPFNPLTCLA
jgi:hypothetical protein